LVQLYAQFLDRFAQRPLPPPDVRRAGRQVAMPHRLIEPVPWPTYCVSRKQMPDQPSAFPKSWENKIIPIRNGTKSRLGEIPILVAEREPICSDLSQFYEPPRFVIAYLLHFADGIIARPQTERENICSFPRK